MWKILDHQENELSERAVKSDIALSRNVSFIPILFLPQIPYLNSPQERIEML